MKTNNKCSRVFTFFFLFLIIMGWESASAQQIHDTQYGFKINIPSGWSKASHMDGTDKVYDFYSADQNIAVQLRAFQANPRVTTDLLVQTYEQNMLPKGTKKESLGDHITANGIPGKLGAYSMKYNNNPVALGVFYTVQNNKGYVLTIIVPTSMMEQKQEEIQQVTQSFQLDNFHASRPPAQKKPGGLGGIAANTHSQPGSFRVIDISLTDHLNADNTARNPKSNFSPQTPEIFVVIQYQGGTSSDLTVRWIYDKWNRVITSSKYNFTSKTGGTAAPSLTKPNKGWPIGSYSVKIEIGNKLIRTLHFTVSSQHSNITTSQNNGSNPVGKYHLVSRTDGNNSLNYWYITLYKNGTYKDEHQLKGNPPYTTGEEGTWKISGKKVVLYNKYNPNVYTVYSYNNHSLVRTTKSCVFTFKK
jgi:hypothetical protein